MPGRGCKHDPLRKLMHAKICAEDLRDGWLTQLVQMQVLRAMTSGGPFEATDGPWLLWVHNCRLHSIARICLCLTPVLGCVPHAMPSNACKVVFMHSYCPTRFMWQTCDCAHCMFADADCYVGNPSCRMSFLVVCLFFPTNTIGHTCQHATCKVGSRGSLHTFL